MDEKKIAGRVARSMVSGIRVPAYNNRMKTVSMNVEFLETAELGKLCLVGSHYFDAEQLDALIDTLKSAQRRM
jgi:hypothetical protein